MKDHFNKTVISSNGERVELSIEFLRGAVERHLLVIASVFGNGVVATLRIGYPDEDAACRAMEQFDTAAADAWLATSLIEQLARSAA